MHQHCALPRALYQQSISMMFVQIVVYHHYVDRLCLKSLRGKTKVKERAAIPSGELLVSWMKVGEQQQASSSRVITSRRPGCASCCFLASRREDAKVILRCSPAETLQADRYAGSEGAHLASSSRRLDDQLHHSLNDATLPPLRNGQRIVHHFRVPCKCHAGIRI